MTVACVGSSGLMARSSWLRGRFAGEVWPVSSRNLRRSDKPLCARVRRVSR